MIDKKQTTESLIESLSCDLTKVEVMPHPLLRIIPWSIFAIMYISVSLYIIGFRADIIDKSNDITYILELSYVLVMAMSAAFCSSWLCVPDVRGKKWMLAIPTVLLAIFITWASFNFITAFDKDMHLSWHACHYKAMLFGGVPAITILLLSVKGKTTHPHFMLLMNTIFVGALGYIGLRMTCASDEIGHLCYMHIFPYLLFGVILAVLGKRLYRW